MCRSFLTPDQTGNGWDNIAGAKDYDGGPKYYGRFNMGVITLNLPYVALLADKDMNKFWELLDKYAELIHRGLQCRIKRVASATSDVAPILWQNGAIARLPKHASVRPLTESNYSTISFGYAGIYEMTKAMLGVSHTTPEGKEFALQVMQFINDKCAKWRAAEGYGYSVYGTPKSSREA